MQDSETSSRLVESFLLKVCNTFMHISHFIPYHLKSSHTISNPLMSANRYVLYISYACPWANRCLAVLQLKGLSDIIDVVVVHPTWQRTRPDVPGDEHAGWALVDPEGPPLSSPTGHGSFSNEGCTVDKYNNARFIRDLYEKANDTTGTDAPTMRFIELGAPVWCMAPWCASHALQLLL